VPFLLVILSFERYRSELHSMLSNVDRAISINKRAIERKAESVKTQDEHMTAALDAASIQAD